MKRFAFFIVLFVIIYCQSFAQVVLKQRPDAFPPADATLAPKSILMAEHVDEMATWNRYPTYDTYLALMQQWADEYPALCHIDTIGYSVQNRLILSAEICSSSDTSLPEFFYSSTIHGDEVTGYVMMLRLIDTLLTSYGSSPRITALLDGVRICINPLANPDGTYYMGNQTVQGSIRYNADGVDLNRSFPDPFGTTKEPLPQENEAMIDYVSRHHFRLSANLHGGSEVINYPWDCFKSWQNPHPQSQWWREVGQRFVDSARAVDGLHFRDVTPSGVIAGGDWYVIHGGRQDYMNYYHNCLELTMEISTIKTLNSNQLPNYWNILSFSLIRYIEEIYSLPDREAAPIVSDLNPVCVYPNPAQDFINIVSERPGSMVYVYDINGKRVGEMEMSENVSLLNISHLSPGMYFFKFDCGILKIIKQ